MHNMQIMIHIEFLLFMQDIASADSCKSHRTWDTKFDACWTTIWWHTVNAAMALCAWSWSLMDLLNHKALIPQAT